MTEILTENQITYWLVVGIILGAAVVGVFFGFYAYEKMWSIKELKRQNNRLRSYQDWKSRNTISLGD